MSVARLARDRKRQLGQYLTPEATAEAIVKGLKISPTHRVLEPSFGEGAFVFPLLDSVAAFIPRDDVPAWCSEHIFGCEIDGAAHQRFSEAWRIRGLGDVPSSLECCDFFKWLPPTCNRSAATDRRQYFSSPLEYFDLVIGNPPFGGSIDPHIQDDLDAIFGVREGRKVKKETYAFFIVKSVDLLKPGGRLLFICSDTILTIATMTGIRSWLQNNCTVEISEVPGVFADTNQDMLLLALTKQRDVSNRVTVFGKQLAPAAIEATPNRSWRIDSDLVKYFSGKTVGDKMVATSGMTIGNNELFLRRVVSSRVVEPYEFSYANRAITLEREISKARLGKVAPRRLQEVQELEACGASETVVEARQLETPRHIEIPHEDYRYYNKATSHILYAQPQWVVFWRDDGEFVYTYKKTGNWYLHGVGGKPYFGREGFSWALIAQRLCTRYLPEGYVLDSGSPCAFLRRGVERDELFFILGWTLTDLCNHILKRVLNHTRNIQSKDFERLPYPIWVDGEAKQQAASVVRDLVERAIGGEEFSFKSPEVRRLNDLYEWQDVGTESIGEKRTTIRQESLF
jgi:hypothetical protein